MGEFVDIALEHWITKACALLGAIAVVVSIWRFVWGKMGPGGKYHAFHGLCGLLTLAVPVIYLGWIHPLIFGTPWYMVLLQFLAVAAAVMAANLIGRGIDYIGRFLARPEKPTDWLHAMIAEEHKAEREKKEHEALVERWRKEIEQSGEGGDEIDHPEETLPAGHLSLKAKHGESA